MNEAYDAFRVGFARKRTQIKKEMMYGPFIEFAEANPDSIKETYRFLCDQDTPREKKFEIMTAVTESTNAGPLDLLSYVFNRSQTIGAFDAPGRLFDRLGRIFAEAEQLVTDAESAGIDISEEKAELSAYKSSVNVAKEIVDAILNQLKGPDGMES